MQTRIGRPVASQRLKTLTVALGASALLMVPFARRAEAQTVYSSIADPIQPAAPLPPVGVVSASADDYQTSLAASQPTVELRMLQFFGGVQFTGAPDGVNNVLNFRFLDQAGGIPNPVVSFPVAFSSSGSFLQTIFVGPNGIPTNSFIPTNGILEIRTLANSGASATWAFTNTPPSVGTNNAGNAGVRAFLLSASASPEPGSAALLLLGAVALPVGALARRHRKA